MFIEWWNSLGTLSQVLYCIAIPATLVLLIQTIMMLIGIIGYFTVPTVAGWVIQAGGIGNYNRNVNKSLTKSGGAVKSGAIWLAK